MLLCNIDRCCFQSLILLTSASSDVMPPCHHRDNLCHILKMYRYFYNQNSLVILFVLIANCQVTVNMFFTVNRVLMTFILANHASRDLMYFKSTF